VGDGDSGGGDDGEHGDDAMFLETNYKLIYINTYILPIC